METTSPYDDRAPCPALDHPPFLPLFMIKNQKPHCLRFISPLMLWIPFLLPLWKEEESHSLDYLFLHLYFPYPAWSHLTAQAR